MAVSTIKDGAAREPKAIGRRLALWRDIAGYTQTQVAEKLKTSQGTVSAWESGKKPPGLKVGMAYCDSFGLTLDYIYRGVKGGLDWSLNQEIDRRIRKT